MACIKRMGRGSPRCSPAFMADFKGHFKKVRDRASMFYVDKATLKYVNHYCVGGAMGPPAPHHSVSLIATTIIYSLNFLYSYPLLLIKFNCDIKCQF